jgi:hypothetical protein
MNKRDTINGSKLFQMLNIFDVFCFSPAKKRCFAYQAKAKRQDEFIANSYLFTRPAKNESTVHRILRGLLTLFW